MQDPIVLKKAKKVYQIKQPMMIPSISSNKPRISRDDIVKLDTVMEVVITDASHHSGPCYMEYQKNMDEQEKNNFLEQSPNLFYFLKQCLKGTEAEMLDYLWDKSNCDKQFTPTELQFINFLKVCPNRFSCHLL
jgi:hypothetical protein